MNLTLRTASLIIDEILAEGAKRAFQPLTIVVLDAGGHPLAIKRDERAAISRVEIATAKAAGCLGMGFGGRELARRAEKAPALYEALNTILPRGILPVAGGILIRDQDGRLLGAIGVSGDTSDNDEACAVAGIRAAQLIADTGAS